MVTHNEGVNFKLYINVFSPNYRKWKRKFYGLKKNDKNCIDGGDCGYIDGWNVKYQTLLSYDLVKFSNLKII